MLVLITSALVFTFTIYVIAKMWREWAWYLRLIAFGGLLTLVALGWLAASQMDDEVFKSHFLADYVVAVALSVITFFAVEQFLESQRKRALYESCMPAIAHELLRNCSNVAKSLALVKFAMFEGHELAAGLGVGPLDIHVASWDQFMISGHFASLPRKRSKPFDNPEKLLGKIQSHVSETHAFPLELYQSHAELIGWSYGFSSDLQRAYEMIQEAGERYKQIDLSSFTRARVGMAITAVLENPQGSEEKDFARAYEAALTFRRAGVFSIVFGCFVLCEVAASLRKHTSSGLENSLPVNFQEMTQLIISSIPQKLLASTPTAG